MCVCVCVWSRLQACLPSRCSLLHHRYFHNTKTLATTWVRPEVLPASVVKEEVLKASIAAAEAAADASMPNPAEVAAMPLAEGWVEVYDDDGGLYYFNQFTNESVWERERATVGAAAAEVAAETAAVAAVSGGGEWEEVQGDDGAVYYYNSATGESSWTPPGVGVSAGSSGAAAAGAQVEVDGSGDWETVTGDDGQVYYANTVTGETAWTRPGGEAAAGGDAGAAATADAGGEEWEALETDEGIPYYYNAGTGETVWEKPT